MTKNMSHQTTKETLEDILEETASLPVLLQQGCMLA